MSPTAPNPPTAKQLAYLKALADRTATTFTYPHSANEASHEIDRLKQRQPLTPEERTLARRALNGDREHNTYATAPRPEDIVGYGSTATWR